jgi:hypothetical protein
MRTMTEGHCAGQQQQQQQQERCARCALLSSHFPVHSRTSVFCQHALVMRASLAARMCARHITSRATSRVAEKNSIRSGVLVASRPQEHGVSQPDCMLSQAQAAHAGTAHTHAAHTPGQTCMHSFFCPCFTESTGSSSTTRQLTCTQTHTHTRHWPMRPSAGTCGAQLHKGHAGVLCISARVSASWMAGRWLRWWAGDARGGEWMVTLASKHAHNHITASLSCPGARL